ncbi:uncharacterized protein LOC142349036 [Convolutriloba macropyga]|uniref:uncharacterized protein LOC142349036 n=1 Tax=Convolutriloba macropyga TaxID=536237 RepID=UPI003F51EA36
MRSAKHNYSDNGTKLVGAAGDFKECFAELQRNEINVKLSDSGIKWYFNPPAVPHFGGFWERFVRSCKKALLNVLGKQSLKEDRSLTVLCILEQLLNNRSLADVSSDISDLKPLTPNHFLIGQVNVSWPNTLFSGTPVSYRKLFRDQHSILVAIWNRWMNEYLPTLQQGNKLAKEELEEIKKGDVVWITDKNTHPFNFPLGRVEDVCRGDDQRVRADLIKTQLRSYKRPVIKLIPIISDHK